MRFLRDRIASLEDPPAIGEALKGSALGEFWKHRVGDFRIIAHVEDQAVGSGDRGEVY
ncbi:MAG: type II toxin-antitoxin system RelE/ParE family toxin [Methylohalobius sp.]|nr:type II toxin-antitoxin system RelE/ParE family toxin [Methylohalobius sp.]